MSPLREAVIVPLLFLTTFLLGGFRGGASILLIPPPLVAVILAALLVGALARAGVLQAGRLISARRTPLENASGALVAATLFLASAQALNLVIPESGLLHGVFAIFLGVQLLTTLVSLRQKDAMLRSLMVLLGCAFVLRFVVLETLYSAKPGFLKRVITAAMEGVSLGSVAYTSTGAITGYVAFVALAFYLCGLFLITPATESALARSNPTAQLPEA
jgi:hypothetical protein